MLRWLVERVGAGRGAVLDRVRGEGIPEVGGERGWKPARWSTAAWPDDAVASILRDVEVIMGGNVLDADVALVGENAKGSGCTGVCA